MTEWSGIGLDTWDLIAIRMPIEGGQGAGKGIEPLGREEARKRECRIQRDCRMALAQNEPISIGPLRSHGIDAEHAPVQRGQDVGHRVVAADMTQPGLVDGDKCCPTYLGSEIGNV